MNTYRSPAAVRDRLLALSKKTGDDFQLLLTRYAVERLLFRLGESRYSGQFVLKGAMLFALWTGEMHRPTKDLDLLGYGDGTERWLSTVFRTLCAGVDAGDGLQFKADTVEVSRIRDEDEYGGMRVTFDATLAAARVKVQVDVGFGDAVTPPPSLVEYPTLLGMSPPRLRAYPRETVVSEKLETMVRLGLSNSRMKDFYDLWVIGRTFPFEGEMLRAAVVATFSRRKTALSTVPPTALTPEFAEDESKVRQWVAFQTRNGLSGKVGDLADVVTALSTFLLPVLAAVARKERFGSHWAPGGPWIRPD